MEAVGLVFLMGPGLHFFIQVRKILPVNGLDFSLCRQRFRLRFGRLNFCRPGLNLSFRCLGLGLDFGGLRLGWGFCRLNFGGLCFGLCKDSTLRRNRYALLGNGTLFRSNGNQP